MVLVASLFFFDNIMGLLAPLNLTLWGHMDYLYMWVYDFSLLYHIL
jgi:hypothetical protein